MTKTFTAVIGANYGDEGKGRLVNYLAHERSLVVRYSGSAQAAHTVVEDGRRHVFKSFGSATLRGVPTHTSPGFYVNPIVWCEEYRLLKSYGLDPQMAMDPRCKVVIPTDMIINQAMEIARGEDKHGSCGMGVRQAMERTLHPALYRNVISGISLESVDEVLPLLERHLEVFSWTHGSKPSDILARAGVEDLAGVAERFAQDCKFMNDNCGAVGEGLNMHLLTMFDSLVMEGSQGLGLDQGAGGKLPHLTPSLVGVGGLVNFMAENAVFPMMEIVYASRPYLTRHGAGPLEHEGEWDISVTDETNVPNKWQDTLRFAPLNLALMYQRITMDLRWMRMIPSASRPKLRLSLGLTCLDQVENEDFPFYDMQCEQQRGLKKFLDECHRMLNMLASCGDKGRIITCFGEDRDDVHPGELSVQMA